MTHAVAMKQTEVKLSPGYKTSTINSGEMKKKKKKQAAKKCRFLSLSFKCHTKLNMFRLLPSLPLSCFEKTLPCSRHHHAQQKHSAESADYKREQVENDRFPWTAPEISFSEK